VLDEGIIEATGERRKGALLQEMKRTI